MKEPDDKDRVDAELKSYLDGQDGVSAAWGDASAEQPPAALDALILSAARAAAQQHMPKPGNSRQHGYRLAASFMAGVLVTSLYVSQFDGLGFEGKPAGSTPSSLQTADLAGAEAPPVTREVLQVSSEALAQNVSVAVSQIAAEAIPDPVIPAVSPPPQTIPGGPEASTTPARALASSNVLAPADTSASIRVPVPPAAQAPRPEPAEAPAVQADEQAAALANGIAVARTELQEAGIAQLEEIMVTGSRIADAARTPGYRASQEEWLAHILALAGQVSSLVDALDAETAGLEEEISLFSQTYPGVDLEAAFDNAPERE